ncbi:ABC transporter permease [Hyphomicrobium facile]|uniref:Glycine betaine/proline transport system permease protein n=1 Tax=Hyphomicrobium facile TaxID=51670 RepID=A0A1I7NVK3_9HYPH|nr:ABC transporter permease subunit [Hyphomicrobium facile]SFV38687.1 glycine betaine/proline transport system permease protein [Hyphomicrobium facile]
MLRTSSFHIGKLGALPIVPIALLTVCAIVAAFLPVASIYPQSAVVPISRWVGAFMDWLVHDLDFGLFTFREMTRWFAAIANWPMAMLNMALWKGFQGIAAVSWVGVIVAVTCLGYWVGRWRLALLALISFGYFAVFGFWESAMMTLSSIIMAVPLSCILGVAAGALCARTPRVEVAVTVALDFMQTVPVFAYLLPVLFLFGFSPVSAALATAIYAVPAMARATILGMKSVPTEISEYGLIAGLTRQQLVWAVLIPASRDSLMLGLNQVIVLSLNAVIIASLIGAGGLGFDVLSALRSLRIGKGLEAGIAIVLLAIFLDRISAEIAEVSTRAPQRGAGEAQLGRSLLIVGATMLMLTTVLANWVGWLAAYPRAFVLTTGPYITQAVDYINVNYFSVIDSVASFLYLSVLNPVRDAFTGLPWLVGVAAIFAVGYQVRSVLFGAQMAALSMFLVVTGLWHAAMITCYLISISVILALLIGFPLGILGGLNAIFSRPLQILCDILQTLPSFIYLIPVIMLFRVGDIPAILAVVCYSIAPIIRYTDAGLRGVDPSLIEASKAMGCSRIQSLSFLRLPLAVPTILLGLNQTVMLAISMLVLTALVGTEDLGRDVYVALSHADSGAGLVAGCGIAFISIIADRVIRATADNRRKALGFN